MNITRPMNNNFIIIIILFLVFSFQQNKLYLNEP